MEEKLFNLILVLIPVFCTILTAYIIPLFKEWIGNERLAKFEYWVEMGVKAAEMIFKESGKGADKKKYVIDFITNKLNTYDIQITTDQLNVLIEAYVKQMKLEENKLSQ
mgnify:CR=1 FL=1